MSNDLYQEALKLSSEIINWRRALHQIPEIGLQLPQTVSFITQQLTKMGIDYQVYEDCSCVIATIGKGDKCLLLRSDMDALPLKEESGLPFAATNGYMHACGHDMHAAYLLGAAKLLKARENDLAVTVKLFFQSAEETFQGAYEAVKHGILENPKVDAAFAMHVFANTELGTFAYGLPTPMAAAYVFKITITGHGGHGSQPEKCIDPINTGVQIYLALQSLIARECPPEAKATLTIGSFNAGLASNVIPETAVLQGTLRTFEKPVTQLLIKRIGEVAQGVGLTYRSKVEVESLHQVPSLTCDIPLEELALRSIKKVYPQSVFQDNLSVMGSEDFAVISEMVPSAHLVIGAGVADEAKRLGQHNPHIIFNEEALPLAAAVYAQVALDWSEENK